MTIRALADFSARLAGSLSLLCLVFLLSLLSSTAALCPGLPAWSQESRCKDRRGELLASRKRSKGPVPAEQKRFADLSERYIVFLCQSRPDLATQFGIHDYDRKLPDFSPEGIRAAVAALKQLKLELDEIDFDALDRNEQIDWNLIAGDINSRLLDLDDLKTWQTNPDLYSSTANAAVFSLIQRDFAPKKDRLESAIARVFEVQAVLHAGQINLRSDRTPRVYVEIALEQMPGIIEFFEKTLPDYFKDVDDRDALDRLAEANYRCLESLRDYQQFLKVGLLPGASGDFALGAERYSRKLLYDEFVDEPLDELLARGEAELSRLQSEFSRLALAEAGTAKEAGDIDPVAIFRKISAEHPDPGELVRAVSGVLEKIRAFCVEKPIVTIPGEERARVEETPPFARALSFASMDTPGPFEEKAKEAYYYVTVPEAGWSAEKTEEHMRSFCRGDLLNTSVHEAYPGHYVQFLWVNKAPSRIRKILGCSSNAEGWAHYCEQMMVEQGFGAGDRSLELVMVHDALLRVCRYIVGIKMHTRGMTLSEGVDFFVKEGYQEKANGEREAKRGTMDPTYLVYTMGKLKILELRDEYRKLIDGKGGGNFDLRTFHDSFLSYGFPPLPVVRAEMLQLPVKKFF